MLKKIKSSTFMRRLHRTRWFLRLNNAIKNLLQNRPVVYTIADDRHELEEANPVLVPWPKDLPKPKVGLVQEWENPPYWTKYEHFLRSNEFPFEYYDVHKSDWLAASKKFDVIIWAGEAVPQIEEHKRKVFLLEKHCGKACFPSFDTLMWNEDKGFQYEWLQLHGFPAIKTFISYSYPETLKKLAGAAYPLISKSLIGAGSLGVELIRNEREAKKLAGQVFSPVGRATYWPFFRQKDYVYFQQFLPNAGFDLRVVVVGKRAFGYYRDVPKGDFRASGMGLVRKGELPREAVCLAMRLVKELDLVVAAVDMLQDSNGNFQIIEMSPNIQVDTAGQLHVEGVPGAYVFDTADEYHFEAGKWWIQELALYEFFSRWLKSQQHISGAPELLANPGG